MEDIKLYREQVLDVLKQSNNHYNTQIIELEVLNKKFQYHRWLHPWQGSWEVESLFTEEILTNLSKIIKPNSTVIDIGAHTGNMSVAYSLFAGNVFSFEPNPATFEVLEKNSQLNSNIQPFNYAVSDEEGALEFHYSDFGFCNGGFATRTDFGIGVTGHKVPIDVYAINLENFLKDKKIDNVSLIKIDAEGHDKDILKTLTSIINNHKPTLITEIYDGLSPTEITDLLNTIHSLGYKAYDEEKNKLNIDNLGTEIKSVNDIQPGSGHNLICVYDS
jgi:FkbM family methyltransferase|tara:strand:- start:17515 stop:18339 length:825 start_codon:yes stop_codon:yes gene_type:complete